MTNTFDKEKFWSMAEAIDPKTLSALKRSLIMVPHPDDESLACAGLIATLVAQGTDVIVILTTDGSASHLNSKKFPSSKLATLRHEELKQALQYLGVSEDKLICYKAPDSAMPAKNMEGFEELVLRLSADLISFQPELILVPYYLDPHCDHRATHQLLIAGLEKACIPKPRIWEYPIWLYENAADSDIPVLTAGELLYLDMAQYLDLKKKCIYAHRSQTTAIIDDDPEGFILLPEVIANFTQKKEYFMERKLINPDATLGEEYFERLYQQSNDPWNFETSMYEEGKYQATIAAIPPGSYRKALEIGCSIGVLTELVAPICDHLIAMDISKTAVERARRRISGSEDVEFLIGGIPNDFPSGPFDLIIMSEVGYYLSMEDLLRTRSLIMDALTLEGILILVHWTHFVADYPLSGDEVHDCFNALGVPHLYVQRKEDYRLDVYKKS